MKLALCALTLIVLNAATNPGGVAATTLRTAGHSPSRLPQTAAHGAVSDSSPQTIPTVERAARIEPPPPNYKFPDGQSYVFDVEWRLWHAGVATLRMDAAGGEQHIHGSADALGVAALLYKVHDIFDSYFDPRTFCSLRLQKHTEEGFRRVETATRFDYERHKSVLQQTNLRNGDKKQVEHDIPDCVTDVLSALFYVASLPLTAGAIYNFPLNDGGETVDVALNVEAREDVITPAGTFHAVRVQPLASKGVLKDRGRIWVWYTDDASHIPVQVRARMFWGILTMRLSRVEK